MYREWFNRGAVGIIEYFESISDVGVGKGNYIKLYGDTLDNLGVPILAQKHLSSIEDGSHVTLMFSENVWYNTFMSPWVIAVHVFLIVLTCASFSVSIIRMTQFVAIDGFRLSIPKVGLFIELVANSFRLAWCIPDPHGYLFIVPGWYDEVFKVYYTLFSNISNLLIVLYWHESMTSLSLEVTPYLKKMAIPFYIAAGAIVFAETLLSIVRIALFPEYDLTYTFYATAVFHTIANVSIIVYLSIISYRLLKRLRHQSSRNNGSNGMITRLLIRVSTSLFIMIGLVIQAACWILFPSVRSEPVPKLVYWSMAVVNFNALSVIQALSFIPSRLRRKTTSARRSDLSSTRENGLRVASITSNAPNTASVTS
mmetsp:Transcript_8906/g.9880  ORF Transcript_8906/g.9880 Transcript_8906/m.9880 type:complete len:368 (-) Transcript_8906:50-1153(-)